MTKETESQARTALALGFSSPIIGGTIALILGLIVFDITEPKYEIWVWVLIHVILGASLVLGTRWATTAYNYSLSKRSKKTGAEKSARNLSFVLWIIWAVWVIIMSFVKQAEAVGKLRVCDNDVPKLVSPTGFCPIDPLSADVIFGEFAASVVLLLVVTMGIFQLLIERGRELPKATAK